ncbi:GNAT family N-acetyltransferase [Crossiella sp. NPDC003009]
MLKLAGARLLEERDLRAVRAALDADPVAACMVASRVEIAGCDPWRLGGEMWGFGSRLDGLCFSGANLVPLAGGLPAVKAFADRALRRRRGCSSLVGPAEQVMPLWEELTPEWGPAREVREDQPLMAMAGEPVVAPDPLVRPVRPDELDQYLPAAVAMFIEEVGIDPRADDGGASYRARVAELVAGGRAFARFEQGEVVFKAEIGALSARVGQIQGVWVHPDRRGQGLGTAGTAAVADRLVRGLGRIASLYVNAYNTPARAAYQRIGFRQVGQFSTVLF